MLFIQWSMNFLVCNFKVSQCNLSMEKTYLKHKSHRMSYPIGKGSTGKIVIAYRIEVNGIGEAFLISRYYNFGTIFIKFDFRQICQQNL